MKELLRIADTIDNKKDAEILRCAAIKLIPEAKPKFEETQRIPGWGYQHIRLL